jgi:hypothetical protein
MGTYGRRRLVSSFLLGAWIYSLLVWGWIGLNLILNPRLQTARLTIYIPIPQNLIADIAFVFSFVCFVLWEYYRKSS